MKIYIARKSKNKLFSTHFTIAKNTYKKPHEQALPTPPSLSLTHTHTHSFPLTLVGNVQLLNKFSCKRWKTSTGDTFGGVYRSISFKKKQNWNIYFHLVFFSFSFPKFSVDSLCSHFLGASQPPFVRNPVCAFLTAITTTTTIPRRIWTLARPNNRPNIL